MTNPDCTRRRSTLQRAHWPVRGHTGAADEAPALAAAVVDAPAGAAATLPAATVAGVEEAIPVSSEAARVHAAAAAQASRNTQGNFVIDL
jgi:microcystin-dependent protein